MNIENEHKRSSLTYNVYTVNKIANIFNLNYLHKVKTALRSKDQSLTVSQQPGHNKGQPWGRKKKDILLNRTVLESQVHLVQTP